MSFSLELGDYALVAAASAFAGFVQGLTGFGSVLTALPLLAMSLGIKTAAPLANLISLGVSLTLCLKLRADLDWRRVRPLALSSLPGAFCGAFLLAAAPAPALEALLGGALLVLPGHHLVRCLSHRLAHRLSHRLAGKNQGPKSELSATWAHIAGFASGLLGGSAGAYGPPVIIYAMLQPWDVNAAKATMTGYFAAAGLLIAASHALGGMIDGSILLLTALALPFLCLGALIGTMCSGRFDDRSHRDGVMLILCLVGLILLRKSFFSLLHAA